ncbi:MAG: hypothetical protein QOK37_1170 [Thermoanaerobaculia bacterium]|jgi:hypothetical protein|nr:hypothetical protein [Thermoanaerobaculia bacterium]
MHSIGLALFLYAATANSHQALTMNTAVIRQADVTSPDPAPPHPLTPRTPPVERPPDSVLRAVLEVAKAAFNSHGH